MIFTECPKCGESLIYPYEAGDKPCGKGNYGGIICPGCKSEVLVERVSIDGETWIKEDLEKEHPELKKLSNL